MKKYKDMKPSEKCKSMGLKSLNELAEACDESIPNLVNWDKKRPERFKMLLTGAAFSKLAKTVK